MKKLAQSCMSLPLCAGAVAARPDVLPIAVDDLDDWIGSMGAQGSDR